MLKFWKCYFYILTLTYQYKMVLVTSRMTLHQEMVIISNYLNWEMKLWKHESLVFRYLVWQLIWVLRNVSTKGSWNWHQNLIFSPCEDCETRSQIELFECIRIWWINDLNLSLTVPSSFMTSNISKMSEKLSAKSRLFFTNGSIQAIRD